MRQPKTVGPWFDELCDLWLNRERCDRLMALKFAQMYDKDGARILAAAKELTDTNWSEHDGMYQPRLSNFIKNGVWQQWDYRD